MNLKFRRKKKLDKDVLTQEIITALRSVYDPEIPVNIYDLGLIYTIEIADNADVSIQMTLTTPACPVAQTFPATVQESVKKVPQVQDVTVELVWDPAWSQDNMSEAAKLQLGLL